MEFFSNHASNYLVSIAIRISRVEKKIVKNTDSEALVELYNTLEECNKLIDLKIQEIEKRIERKRDLKYE